jgi:hypothetical protein
VALYASDGAKVRTLDTNPVYERLQYRFGTPVKILRRDNKGGKIEIVFHGKDDLDRVVDILLGH